MILGQLRRASVVFVLTSAACSSGGTANPSASAAVGAAAGASEAGASGLAMGGAGTSTTSSTAGVGTASGVVTTAGSGATGVAASGGTSGAPTGSGGVAASTAGSSSIGGATSGAGAAAGGVASAAGAGAVAGTSASGAGGAGPLVGPGTYALPPPSQCHNQDFIDFQEGCEPGVEASTCGGKCNTINACLESTADKPNADITFMCPRSMLFSAQMLQAAIDDGNDAFNYAVVGHDVDRGGIDGQDDSTCCQCYQLVFAHPSPSNERQVLSNPDNPNPPESAIPLPKPLIAQSFNTAATPTTFDVYMGAGGLGANNACAPSLQPQARSGQYLYTSYPSDGQPSQGGVKPVSLYSECKTDIQWVTTETLSSEACQSRVAEACNQIASDIPGLTEQARSSCISSNSPESYYHLNWSVFAMKVECPQHLTEVTGCKLAPQGLPAVKRDVTTAAQASTDSDFWSTTSNGSNMYETTTMEDCCRPSCASKDWVEGRGLSSDPEYNAFYSCDSGGVPITE